MTPSISEGLQNFQSEITHIPTLILTTALWWKHAIFSENPLMFFNWSPLLFQAYCYSRSYKSQVWRVRIIQKDKHSGRVFLKELWVCVYVNFQLNFLCFILFYIKSYLQSCLFIPTRPTTLWCQGLGLLFEFPYLGWHTETEQEVPANGWVRKRQASRQRSRQGRHGTPGPSVPSLSRVLLSEKGESWSKWPSMAGSRCMWGHKRWIPEAWGPHFPAVMWSHFLSTSSFIPDQENFMLMCVDTIADTFQLHLHPHK